MRLGWTEIILIVILVMILFMSNKIPGMMRNLANGINVFKKELKDTKKSDSKKTVKKSTAKKSVKKK
ncbi:MAG: twin-arginine translocase TatA/TatE family subunit [Alphaproteobacteria bacterium]|nr:twin-arginine translocase TatA/TatE family subunit [Alphaproteobacteria bacterium]